MTIGEKIKTCRKLSGITQQELSEKAGISRSHVAAIEIGQYKPSIETLSNIASALDVNIGDIIDDNIQNAEDKYKNRLAEMRTLKELTIGEVAKIVNDTIPNMVIYEQNIKQPSYNILKTLANYYNVSIDYLSGKSNNQNIIQYNLNDDNSIIIIEDGGTTQTSYKLNSEDISLVKAIINAIKNERTKSFK